MSDTHYQYTGTVYDMDLGGSGVHGQRQCQVLVYPLQGELDAFLTGDVMLQSVLCLSFIEKKSIQFNAIHDQDSQTYLVSDACYKPTNNTNLFSVAYDSLGRRMTIEFTGGSHAVFTDEPALQGIICAAVSSGVDLKNIEIDPTHRLLRANINHQAA